MIRKIFFAITIFFTSLIAKAQVPTISGFAPSNATIGTTIIISGTNFSANATNNIVYFGNVKAVVNAATATSLSVSVPAGASYGPIRVINNITNSGVISAGFFMPTFSPAKGTPTNSDFAANVDFATNTNPNAITWADIDGDGKLDMIVANSNSANVSVYRNTGSTGTIAFAAKIDFTTAASPLALFAADIDGDGLIDIVTANSTANSISVLKNTSTAGSISFASKIDFTTASTPGSITGGDFDGDGLIDIAVANRSSNSVSVFRNTTSAGAISFASKVDFTTAGNPYSIATGDIDGDGKIEIAVTNRSSNSISVFKNTSSSGTISFAAKTDFTSGSDPVSIAIGDLDGDGKLDIITQNWQPGTASAFRNTSSIGTISLANKVDINVFGSGYSLTLADINGDGKVDAVATHTTTNIVGILLNNSTVGSISIVGTLGLTTGTGSNPQGVFAVDIDGDGLPDVGCVNYGSNTARIYRSIPVVLGPPVVNTHPANSSICAGISTKFYVNASGTPTLSYQWQIDNGTGFVNISNGSFYTGSTTDTLFVKNADITITGFKYRCIVTNTLGSANSNSATLTVYSLPVVAPISGATTVCVNATTSLNSATSGGVWASSNNAFATVNTSGMVTGVSAGTATISYTVTNANNCSTQVTSPVTINALPLPTSITGPSSVCQLKSITLNNTTTGGVWNSANTAVATVNSFGVVTGVTAGNVAINYVVTNANNCSITNTTSITVLSQPTKTPIVKDTLICKATSLTVDATVSPLATYAWTASAGGFTSLLPVISISTPAMYRVTITLSNGCFYLDSVNLRNTVDTAIKAKMLLTSQAYLNENVVAVNITNPSPQTSTWAIPAGAQTVSQTTSNLILKFNATGKYQVGLKTTSYNVCNSNDSGVVIISNKDTTVASTNTVVVREVNVGPNPSTGIFNFVIKLNKSGKVSLKIYSISGSLVYNTVIPEVTGVTTINQQANITNFPKDTYIAVVQTSDAYEVRTLIKN